MNKTTLKSNTVAVGLAMAFVIATAWCETATASLTYSISGTWPGTSATDAATAMAAIVADYNSHGNFPNL